MSPAEEMETRHELFAELEEIEAELLDVLCQKPSNRVVARARELLDDRAVKADELRAVGYQVTPIEEVYEVMQEAV
jgi:hypothetical protein